MIGKWEKKREAVNQESNLRSENGISESENLRRRETEKKTIRILGHFKRFGKVESNMTYK